MKHTKLCPKCGSAALIIVDGYAGCYGAGNNIMTGMTVFSAVPVDRYICMSCGFTEEWVRKEDIPKILQGIHSHG